MTPSSPLSRPDASLKTWSWRGFPIAYQTQGQQGAAVVMVHGFGASSGHWRKNLPVLGENCRCYAIDLIGFGASAKPKPGAEISYTFETWGEQIADFCSEVVGEPVFLVGNSIGCIAAMQAAVAHPNLALGIVAIDFSLRRLHDRKQAELPWYRRLSALLAQKLLNIEWIGHFFFKQLAKPKVVRNILLQAYKRPEAVTNELIDLLMEPAQDSGAADVFVAFTSYSQGPLPEDLLPILPCSAILLWGTEDPWEPIEIARQFADYPTVEKFIPLEGLGHCPQDEAPEIVNPILQEWIREHSV
ncbi:MAG: alpha/beta hydrolase [Cyanobacteria bacterium QH_2_48_84]|nr:MAG: alpha/beta hydrolase [Cyanobacteria bacterium QH_2_48_84]